MNDFYAIYLRKSRADTELEKLGQGETLARHRAALLELAEKRQYHISHIYQEIVSGDSIISRPQMQELMRAVENGEYKGVLVMEIERLARGDTIDQGLVAQTFKSSGTLIVTPSKTYDPNNEFDENFFEFSLFMSRQEYKTIKRRLTQGRYAAAKEGKFIAPIPPYGYIKVPLSDGKGSTLAPVDDEAAIVRLIYNLYINGLDGRRMGIQSIAHYLNEHGHETRGGDYWTKRTVSLILNNPTYAGKIRYGYRKTTITTIDGHRRHTKPTSYRDNCVIADGLHPPIIPLETWEKAQELSEHKPLLPVGSKRTIKNPLAGLIICKMCGKALFLRGYNPKYPNMPPYLVCKNKHCQNVSAPLFLIEDRLLEALEEWCKRYELSISPPNEKPVDIELEALQAALRAKEKELDTLNKQLAACYDLLERGTYSDDVFRERSATLTTRITTANNEILSVKMEISDFDRKKRIKTEFAPHIRKVIEAYRTISDPPSKNALLREILDRADYLKEHKGVLKGVSADDFTLDIFPILPKSAEL